jgi:hypothetical protein
VEILIDGSYSTVDSNTIGNGADGITLNGTNNRVVRNIFDSPLPNVAIVQAFPATNDIGPLSTAAAATSPWANLQR